jgi:hypothetical protein
MEGAIMLTKLYDDPIHLRHAIARVRERIESLAAGRSVTRRPAVKTAATRLTN